MLQRILLPVVLAGAVFAGDIVPREVAYSLMDPYPHGGCSGPVFDKGYFFELKNTSDNDPPPNGYSLFGPDGNLRYRIDIVAPDDTPARLSQNAAIDTGGAAILPIWYGGYGGNGPLKGSGIVFVDPSGRQMQFIATGSWVPQHVCFAPDHTVWAAGTKMVPFRDSQTAASGRIYASGDRIGIEVVPGHSSRNPEWIELDFDGKLLGRWKLGPSFVADPDTKREIYSLGSPVFTTDGRLFSQIQDGGTKTYQVKLFDRATSSWQAPEVPLFPPAHSYLVGADQNNLAFENPMEGVRLSWISAAPIRYRGL